MYGATAISVPWRLPAFSASKARAIGSAAATGRGSRATSRAAGPRPTRSTAAPSRASASAMRVSAVTAGLRLPPNATYAESAPKSATVIRSTARSTMTVPTARPNDDPPFCLRSQARYTSPIFAGKITLTQNDRARISTAARRERLMSIVVINVLHRRPRRISVPKHAARAAVRAAVFALVIALATCSRLKLLAALQSATRRSAVNAKAKSVDGRVARSRMLNVVTSRFMRRTFSLA